MRVAKWGQFTRDYKVRVVERMRECSNIKALAAELQVSRQALYRWKDEIEGNAGRKRSAAAASSGSAELRKEIVYNHAQILELQSEYVSLEKEMKSAKTPVRPMNPMDPEKKESVNFK